MNLLPLAYTLTGIGVYVQQLVTAIHRVDPSVQIVFPLHCELPSRSLLARLISRNLDHAEVRRIELCPHFGFSPFGPFGSHSPRQLAGNFDVYHVTNTVSPYAEFSRPTVVSVYDLAEMRLKGRNCGAYAGLVPLIRQASLSLCISRATQIDVIELLDIPEERTVVTPLAPRPFFCPPPTEDVRRVCTQEQNAGRPYFLAVSTIEPRKNYVRMIEAFARLRERSSELHLIVAGAKRSAWPDVKRAVQERGLVDAVRVLGWVTDARLLRLMWGSSGLLYPSLYEGFGLPVVEAMATGTPVVASNVGSLPEVVGDAFPLVDPYCADSILEGMQRVLMEIGPESRAALCDQAAKFRWDRTAELTIAAYQQARS